MCKEGRRQSPINVDPATLLFDPNLTPFTLDKVTVSVGVCVCVCVCVSILLQENCNSRFIRKM